MGEWFERRCDACGKRIFLPRKRSNEMPFTCLSCQDRHYEASRSDRADEIEKEVAWEADYALWRADKTNWQGDVDQLRAAYMAGRRDQEARI